jgi:hypothetical protein
VASSSVQFSGAARSFSAHFLGKLLRHHSRRVWCRALWGAGSVEEPRIEFGMRENRCGVARRESDDDIWDVGSQCAPLIAAYRFEVCRHEVARHVGHRGRGRWVGRPEAGRDARRDARRRDLGGDLDHAWGRCHCSP